MRGMVYRRRRGAAIVETSSGILVVSGRRKLFILPGGGANRGESRRKAAMRELHEETGLTAISSHFLFKYVGAVHKNYKGGHFRDYNKVFLVKTKGIPRPRHEVKHIAYYRIGSRLNISKTTREIIEKYKRGNN
ncbi:MAG: NUDIX hydrolase [Candidatus Micrarchaeota archaeon]|nr:NUDIX hydrolase [Candidatus Micrarchaeota archaeon]